MKTKLHKTSHLFFLLFLLAAICCGCSSQVAPSSDVTAIFPHPSNVALPEIHGAWVNESGTTNCLQCHPTDADPNLTTTAPACHSCHPLFPHTDNWAATENHGTDAFDNGVTTCQTQCHGTDLLGGLSTVSCIDNCHNLFPHSSSPATCTPCHDTEITNFSGSGHASSTGAFAAESNRTQCMRCHTATGFNAYNQYGIQSAEALAADTPDPLTCTACHNSYTANYTSGITLDTAGFVPGDNPTIYNLAADGGQGTHIELSVGKEGLCLKCHTPRSSDGAIKVNTWVYGLADVDATSSATYTFAQYPANTAVAGTKSSNQNRVTSTSSSSSVVFHYLPIMATFYGNDAKEGFQYQTDPDGNALTYVGKNDLMEGYTTCVNCHSPHTTEVDPANCTPCHSSVTATADFRNIRVTTSDYDGDGNATEGMYDEIETMKAKLLEGIQNYAKIKGTISFDPTNYSSWRRGDDTTKAYNKNTPRLIKACYNYHLAYKEAGAYVHNSKYIGQLLYDSMKDLNVGITVPADKIDMTGMVRP